MELFPAVLIGGPPNSGKSVLTYSLTQKLRELGVQHYVLRAAPDGEGDWAAEADENLVRTILVPRTWTPAFVEHVCESLAHRPLPLIVDAGGRPQAWQEPIFDHCTHAILLTLDQSSHDTWLTLANRHNLILLADLRSELYGEDKVTATHPVLKGTIAGLDWGKRVKGSTFDALTERTAGLFAYDTVQLRHLHLASAPVETTIALDRLAHILQVPSVGKKAIWEPHNLPALLDYLPEATALGLYGRAPNWVYAAVALLAHPAPFYQFDIRLGWIRPPTLHLSKSAADNPLQVKQKLLTNHSHLAFTITKTHLDYTETDGLVTPPIPADQGLVISGKLPLWLYTALALVYTPYASWLAVYQPQREDKAVVVGSHHPKVSVGDQIVSPPG
jgi:CRISPR-associated protein Csx3